MTNREKIINNNNKLDQCLNIANEMPETVDIILQSKTVTPTKLIQDVIADPEYTGLEKVTIEAIPDEYIVPNGTLDIAENGTYDVADKEFVNVDILGSGGSEDLNEVLTEQEGVIEELGVALGVVEQSTFSMRSPYKQQLEYIESTGTQWIDIGTTIDTSTDEIEMYFELTEEANYKWFFGEYDTNARLGLGSGDGENKRNFLYKTSVVKIADIDMYEKKHKYAINASGGFVDDIKKVDLSNFASTSTLYLFNLNIDSSSDYRCKARVWSYKQSRNGTLIRDLIPVFDHNDIPCMFDRVTEQFFYNQGSGEFLYKIKEDYTSNSNRIRKNTEDLRGYVDVVNNLPDYLEMAASNQLIEYTNDTITSIRAYGFRDATALIYVSMPNLTSSGAYSFQNTGLQEVYMPKLQNVANNMFYGTKLTNTNFPKAQTIYGGSFQNCAELMFIDLPLAKSLNTNAFNGCAKLEAVILRNTTTCTLANVNAFTNSSVASGTGFVYVPKALLSIYQSATNWSTYAAQIRAIEDYPEITGG